MPSNSGPRFIVTPFLPKELAELLEVPLETLLALNDKPGVGGGSEKGKKKKKKKSGQKNKAGGQGSNEGVPTQIESSSTAPATRSAIVEPTHPRIGEPPKAPPPLPNPRDIPWDRIPREAWYSNAELDAFRAAMFDPEWGSMLAPNGGLASFGRDTVGPGPDGRLDPETERDLEIRLQEEEHRAYLERRRQEEWMRRREGRSGNNPPPGQGQCQCDRC